ncbi:hypothetical protein GCM10027347_26750 [Larkinella harenae]
MELRVSLLTLLTSPDTHERTLAVQLSGKLAKSNPERTFSP